MRVQNFILGERGHTVVFLSVEFGVCGVGNNFRQPGARTVARQVRRGGVFVGLVELVAIGAVHFRAGEQRLSFPDDGVVAFVAVALRLQLGFG